jgi:ABC-2 type transport system permease protein
VNIYLRELKANLKSLLIWVAISAVFVLIGISKFSSFAGNPDMLALLDSVPPAFLDAFSMRALNLTTLNGFFGMMSIYFFLMGAMAAALWGSDIITKEERDRTVEFSLVLPISRSRVITAKALAALTNCVLYALFMWGISLVAVRAYQPDQAVYDFLLLLMVSLLLLELIFLAVGLLLGCAMKHRKLAGSTAIGIILAAYFMAMLTSIQPDLDFLNYLSPFKYFDAVRLLNDGHIESLSLLLTAGIVGVCLAAAYWAYNRRDLYI